MIIIEANNIFLVKLNYCLMNKIKLKIKMNAFIQKHINYLKTTTFKKHRSGNYGMYGLNFLCADPVIQMKGDIWKFIWWETGTDNATFVNSKGVIYTFNPKNVYYSKNRDDVIRMEPYIDENIENSIIDY